MFTFRLLLPLFVIVEVKCNELNNEVGGPGMCSTEHTKFFFFCMVLPFFLPFLFIFLLYNLLCIMIILFPGCFYMKTNPTTKTGSSPEMKKKKNTENQSISNHTKKDYKNCGK